VFTDFLCSINSFLTLLSKIFHKNEQITGRKEDVFRKQRFNGENPFWRPIPPKRVLVNKAAWRLFFAFIKPSLFFFYTLSEIK